MIGLLGAAAALLLLAGLPKLWAPEAGRSAVVTARLPWAWTRSRWLVRSTGVAEVAVAVSVVVLGGRVAAALVAVTFLALAAFSWRMLRVAPAGTGCGCFGSAAGPVSRWHVGTNLAFAAVAAAALVRPPASLWAELGTQPWAGVPLLVLTGLLTYCAYLLMTALPSLLQATHQEVAAR